MLSPEFISVYKDLPVPMDTLGYIVYKRTYARVKKDGSVEDWYETLRRCINGAIQIGTKWTVEEVEKIYDYMFNLKCLFPGRGLWQLGTDTVKKYGSDSLCNCLAGETKVLTKQGWKEIKSLLGKKVELVTTKGKWVKAPIQSFGEQKLYKITFRDSYNKVLFSIHATAEHDWINKENNEKVKTINLKRGFETVLAFPDEEPKSDREVYVVAVEETHRYEEVYCAVVPNTHTFVIDHNILTGNCWYKTIDDPVESFCFIMNELMLGGGVGFSVQKEFIYKLPKVKRGVKVERDDVKDADFIVPDSREGWIELLRQVLKCYFITGESLTYSCQLIRAYGESIKSFGGVATGPKILSDGITKICGILDKNKGKSLKPIDVLDVVDILGSVVVSGNIRRSALICLGDYEDTEYLKAKRFDLGNIPNWRAMSNNSVVCDDVNNLPELFWDTYKSQGEPYGLFNLALARKCGRSGEENIDETIDGLNPCQPGFATVIKSDVITTLDNVNEGDEIWGSVGYTKIIKKVSRGIKPVFRYHTTAGFFIGTEDHKIISNGIKIPVNEAKSIDILIYPDIDRKIKYASISSDIIKKEYLGEHEVYDITVDNESHSYWSGGLHVANCGEICLSGGTGQYSEKYQSIGKNVIGGESCNLSEIFLPNIDSLEELKSIVDLLLKYNKAVSYNKFIHKESETITHQNVRIGISVTGICQASEEQISWLSDGYEYLKERDITISEEYGYNKSIRLTAIKPSGTVSLLAGVTPGIHPAYSEYYIRNVRVGSNDLLVQVCKDHGYPVEFVENFDGTVDHNQVVISFPVKIPQGTVIAKDLTAIDQLELIAKMQTIWADNAVSCTVYYTEEELDSIREWLKINYKDKIKSVSFLRRTDHGFKQAPYIEITEEEYYNLSKDIKLIDFKSTLNTESIKLEEGIENQFECEGGYCPVK